MPHSYGSRKLHRNVYLIGSFALAIAVGTLCLRASFSVPGEPLSFIDALFTATSAVCVTGLTVVDTGTHLSPLGQAVVLILIQLGGLGIMTYTTVVILMMGRRLSLRDQEMISGTLSYRGSHEILTLVRNVFLVTFLFETAGALLLFTHWRHTYPAGEAFYLSLFHSISAFCNAGFSLFSDSLIDYRADPWMNGVIMTLIICGGLGFLVFQEMWQFTRKRYVDGKRVMLSLHSRVTLITTGGLILAGFGGFMLLEWNDVLADTSPMGKFLVSLFQSVTPRTAGFNTVDFSQLTNGMLFFTILLMFIGASPGSAGGGVKTTSFAVLLAIARSRWHGTVDTFLFRRRLPPQTVARAISIILVSLLVVLTATLALMITEQGGMPHSQSRGLFLEHLFEAVSAFATVGLSTGVTPTLSIPGKLIIILLMFVGRLGPITIALAIAGEKKGIDFTYPEEDIMIG